MQAGDFVWYELMTTDLDAAVAFYGKVVGWKLEDSGMPGMRYILAKVGDRQVGGLMGTPPDVTCDKPSWFGYVLVPDVDAAAEKLKAQGGMVHRPPTDIPTVGRFAVVGDPQGTGFMLFTGAGEPMPALPMETPGAIGWHELHAKDWPAAFEFYEAMFGWSKGDGVDMGPMGTYQLFATTGNPVGGMFNDGGAPAPYWLYYFTVDDIDAAAARVTEAGGTIVNGPHEVPGGAWILNAFDPQGALFALVGPKK